MNIEQARSLKQEASALADDLYKATYQTASTEEYAQKAQRVLRKAHERYDRRVELYADLKWPQRVANKEAAQALRAIPSEKRAQASRTNGKKGGRPQTNSIKQRRVKVADEYMASGYGRGTNRRNVYLIDGFFYAYHPAYTSGIWGSLPKELEGYIPVNKGIGGDGPFYYEVSSFDHKPEQ